MKSYKSRQQHLVDKHKFPSSFDFFKKAPPSQKRRQKNHRKQSSVKKADASDMEGENEAIDDTNHSSKQKKKKNQRKQVNLKKPDASSMDVENEDIDNLVSAVSKLSTSDSTPSSITFGRRSTRGMTFVPRVVQRKKEPDST